MSKDRKTEGACFLGGGIFKKWEGILSFKKEAMAVTMSQ